LPEHLAAALDPKRLRILLASCEHVIDAVACVAEALLHASASRQDIATCRESPRVDASSAH
jgi:predicted ATPase